MAATHSSLRPRHGEPSHNRDEQYQNQTNNVISDQGRPISALTTGRFPSAETQVPKSPSVASVATVSDAGVAARPFPVTALPPTLREFVETVADRLAVPDALPACCVLAAVSAAIGSGLRIRTNHERTLRGNIYVAAGVTSGSGKTEVFNTALEPAFDRQHQLDSKRSQRRSLMAIDRILLADRIKKLKA